MENIAVNDHRLHSIVVLYDMQTPFFASVLEGISNNDAHSRLETKANHIAWLAGSLVQQRFELANTFGIEAKQAAHHLFKDNQGIKDDIRYPSLESYRADWDLISPQLRNALIKASPVKLDTTFEMMPGMTLSVYDLLTFAIYREANHIGQIALWRRLLGYEPMKYM
jgi:hypothetical protein